MSLISYLGERANLLNLGADNKKRIMLGSAYFVNFLSNE